MPLASWQNNGAPRHSTSPLLPVTCFPNKQVLLLPPPRRNTHLITAKGPQVDCSCQPQAPSSRGRHLSDTVATLAWEGLLIECQGPGDYSDKMCTPWPHGSPSDRIRSGDKAHRNLDQRPNLSWTASGCVLQMLLFHKAETWREERPCQTLTTMVLLSTRSQRPCPPRSHKWLWPDSRIWTYWHGQKTHRWVPDEIG